MSLRPKKSLGQHFLTDDNIINKIADAIPARPDDRVIEIGPGTGALTEALVRRFENLLALELDERAIAFLEEKFDNLVIHHRNVLEVDWTDYSIGKERTHLVGNLPYYITSQILFSLLESRALLSDAVLMMQKEVAERLVAVPRTKDYGILSVQTQLMSTPEILFPVSRHCFSPQPNVESAMVKLTFDKGALRCTDKHLKTVVRTAFNQRRKKLSNALKPLIAKDRLPAGFDFDKRAEAWPPSEYEKLTALFEKSGILT
ncbi:16S rRNA (adenine(1518)-N(6)/adenine(1519)-N(6))-dimethyltransferase RsmA [Fodinibius sediminis]|uniref:Ribosomal RNA small subunit methyltransferase A n=1 Tax=Fodinibius sediminis TaxID=1214077 RepID=A0A521DGV1_9BACT|nr:16S rRNA (adenine(1518)-N(6)/adenine(1519)-N(6))-dimethyltransferase RsmA [Fodinibius sediminis]SMO70858.1 dimethyladenosine transferase [Fodinibius sediminis]